MPLEPKDQRTTATIRRKTQMVEPNVHCLNTTDANGARWVVGGLERIRPGKGFSEKMRIKVEQEGGGWGRGEVGGEGEVANLVMGGQTGQST
jgi:hypothetical protein